MNQLQIKNIFFIGCSTLLGAGAIARLAALEMVDMRYQEVISNPLSPRTVLVGILTMLLLSAGSCRLFAADDPEESSWKKQFICGLFLLPWLPFWFIRPDFAGLLFIAASGGASWAAVFYLHRNYRWNLSGKQSWTAVMILALLAASGAWYMQCRSMDKMAMQWLDWGHFYEALRNTLNGRFFYLNLSHGCYLGSRFCPALLILLPLAMAGSPKLFLLTGAASVASGALLCAKAMEKERFSRVSILLIAVWFLALPLTGNLLLPLLDGFHETFLLMPAVLGAWYCYRNGKLWWAVVLVLFTFGIRESIGFMWGGYALLLLFRKRFRDGGILLFISVLIPFLLMGIVMPHISKMENYEHVSFFSHLGNSIQEIALSPFSKPEIFWKSLFNRSNILFWISLFLPFIWAIWKRPLFILPLLPDLIMVSLDSRFDSKNIMRHYQMVPYIVLTIAALEGLSAIRRDRSSRRFSNAALGAMLGSTLLSCWCFTQIPGFPPGDTRLAAWSDAHPVMERFFEHLPPKAKVTAGVRVASLLVDRNDIFICRELNGKHEEFQDYVIIESFTPGEESRARRKLLETPGWRLLHHEYLDERLIQLFKRTPGIPSHRERKQIFVCSDRDFNSFGMPVKSTIPQLEMRGDCLPGNMLVIAARLKEKVDFDIAFSVNVELHSGETLSFFTSFGEGVFPAYFGQKGQYSLLKIKLDSPPKMCKVDLVVLK